MIGCWFVLSWGPALEPDWSLAVNWYDKCPASYQYIKYKGKCQCRSLDYNGPNATLSSQGMIFGREAYP